MYPKKKNTTTSSTNASQASTVSKKTQKSSSNNSIKYKYTKLNLKLQPYIYKYIYENANIISKFVKFNKNQIIKTINYLKKDGIYYIDIERKTKIKKIKGGVADVARGLDLKTIAPDELSVYVDFVQISLNSINTIFNKLNANINKHTVYVDHNDGSPQSSIKVVMNFNSDSHLFMIGFVDTNPPQNVQQKLRAKGQRSDIAVLPIHYSFFINESGPEPRRRGIIPPPHSSHFSIHSNSFIFTDQEYADITKHSDPTMGYVSTDWGIFNITYSGNGQSVKINTPIVSFQELLEILNHSDFIRKISFTEVSDDPDFYENEIDCNTSGNEIQQYLEKMCSKTAPTVMRKVLKNFLIPIITEYCMENNRIKTGTNESSTRHYIIPFLDIQGENRQLAAHSAFHVASEYNGIERTYNRLEYQDSQITINQPVVSSIFTINQIQFRDLEFGEPWIPSPQNEMPVSIVEYIATELIVRDQTTNFINLVERQNQEWLELLNKQKLDRDTPDDLRYSQQEIIMYNQFDERYNLIITQYNNLLRIKNYYVPESPQFFYGTTAQYQELYLIQNTAYNHILQILSLHHRNQINFYTTRMLNNTKFDDLRKYQQHQVACLTAVLNKHQDIIKSLINAGDTTPVQKQTIYSDQLPELERLHNLWLNAKYRFSGFQGFGNAVERPVEPLYIGQIVNNDVPMRIEGGTKPSSERNKYPLIVSNNSLVSSFDKKLKQINVLTFKYDTTNNILQTFNYFKIIPIITKLSNIKSFRFKDAKINDKNLNESTLFKIDTIITNKLEREDFIRKFNIYYVALNVINTTSSNKEYFIRHTRKAQVLKLSHKQLLKNLTYSTINSNGRASVEFCSSYEYEHPGSSLLEIISPKDTTIPYFQDDKKEVTFLDEKYLLLSSLYTISKSYTDIKKTQNTKREPIKTQTVLSSRRNPTNLIEEIIYIKKK